MTVTKQYYLMTVTKQYYHMTVTKLPYDDSDETVLPYDSDETVLPYDSDETVLPDDIDNIDRTSELLSDVDYTYTPELFSEPDCSMQHLTYTPPLHTIHSSTSPLHAHVIVTLHRYRDGLTIT